MTKHQETWETYVSAWRVPSTKEKQAALDAAVAEGCTYRDPLMETKGHAQLLSYMVDFHKQLPGGQFVTCYFLAHHDRSIARWNMVDAQGAVIGDGPATASMAPTSRCHDWVLRGTEHRDVSYLASIAWHRVHRGASRTTRPGARASTRAHELWYFQRIFKA
jgi:hypothetical protein